ncbi:MAG: hypothetical protein R3C68_09870 [Myxococcota bacterium]
MSAADTHARIMADPLLGPAWSAFGRRLKHHGSYPDPEDDQTIASYLQVPPEYFVTSADRCARLAEAQLPNWETSGSYFQGRQHLLKAWKPEWLGKRLDSHADSTETPLGEHLSIHFEVELPTGETRNPLKCAVHFETYPYMSKSTLQKRHAHLYETFKKAAEVFQEALHNGIKGSEWTAKNYAIEKASIHLEFGETPTVGQLGAKLRNVMDKISDVITDSLKQAKQASRSTP